MSEKINYKLVIDEFIEFYNSQVKSEKLVVYITDKYYDKIIGIEMRDIVIKKGEKTLYQLSFMNTDYFGNEYNINNQYKAVCWMLMNTGVFYLNAIPYN